MEEMVATQPPITSTTSAKIITNNLKIYMCGKNATYMDDKYNQQINTYENNNNNVKITKRKKKEEKWGKKINLVQNVVEGWRNRKNVRLALRV